MSLLLYRIGSQARYDFPMIFDWTLNTGNLLTAVGFAGTIVSLSLTRKQMVRNGKTQRAQFVLNVIDKLFSDGDGRKFFYKVDYEKFQFSSTPEGLKTFKGSDDERHLDALLYRYDSIGRMIRMNIIEMEDVEPFLFEIIQVLRNSAVRDYIAWLESEFEKFGAVGANRRARPHDDARWLVEQLENKPAPA